MAQRRDQPEQQAPPVQKLRLRYRKRGRARFTSHRDFSRAFERALRRAAIPMAYSSGYNPHPRVSFANASPTGAATEAEYLEIGLAAVCDPEWVRTALSEALPDGMDVVEAVVAGPGALADRLTASDWEVDINGVEPSVMEHAVAALLAAPEAVVSRMTKNGVRSFDARGAVLSLTVAGPGRLGIVLEHRAPLVRPDDVVAALTQVDPGFAPTDPPLLTRRAQGEWRDGRLVGPFEA